MSRYNNPHEHADYLKSLPGVERVLVVTSDGRFFEVMASDQTWAHLAPCQSNAPLPVPPYWMRWEVLSELGGIRFETRGYRDDLEDCHGN